MNIRSLSKRLGALTKLISLLMAAALVAAACGSSTDDVVADATGAVDDAVDDAVDAADNAADDAVDAADEPETAEEDGAADDPADEAEAPAEDDRTAELVIVSMSPTATEMLFAIGAGDYVVAADNNSNFPLEAPTNADLTSFPVNVEGIISFEPTLVVTSAPIEGLAEVGIEELVLPFAATFDDAYTQIEQLGAATGNVGEAAELVSQMQTDIAAIVEATNAPDTALTYYHELEDTLFSSTSSTFVGQVYSLFGLENVADAADPDGESFGFPQLSEEFLVTADPDLIFLADTICCGQNTETVAARPGWDALSAVTNGNVIELNDDIASRWGPRLVDYVAAISDAITAANVPVAN